MLAQKFTENTPLPHPGSIGYLRGTAQRVRVIRRNPAGPGPDDKPTCLVQLYHRPRGYGAWEPVSGSSGNTLVAEEDIYPTERKAQFCGRAPTPPRTNRRRGGRA